MKWFRKLFSKKKIQYTVISERHCWNLSSKVTEHLNDGWVCVGGVSHMRMKTGGNTYDYESLEFFSQAMMRVE